MNLKKKLEFLGDKYKVPRGTMDLMRWSDAVKKAANWKESIDQLYARETGTPSATTSGASTSVTPSQSKPPVVIEGKAVEVREKPASGVTVEGAAQRVDVAAPQINVHIPAPSVSVQQGKAEAVAGWTYAWDILERVGSHAFTLLAGVGFGVLVSKKVLALVGLT